jgi:hypothetical protein
MLIKKITQFISICLLFVISMTLYSQNLPGFKQDVYNYSNGFIENKGQWDKEIVYAHKGQNKNVIVTSDKIIYDFYEIDSKNISKTGGVLAMAMNNISQQSEIIPLDPYDYHYNYFIGDVPNKWTKNVMIYRNIKIKNIYDSIDLLLTLDNDQPRYDLIVNPGGNPSEISFSYEGQDELRINDNGNIELKIANNIIENNSLYAYQEINGIKKQVDCKFTINDNKIFFELGKYDKNIQLVIDPIVLSSYFGGSDHESFSNIKMDKNGDFFLIGSTNSDDFYITPGAYKKEKDFYNVAAISKIRISGDSTKLLYSTFFGGSGGDGATDIYVGDNNIFFTGYTRSFDFPKVKSIMQELSGNEDCFVVKMNSSLDSIYYSTVFGGNMEDIPKSIDVQSNEAYITGQTKSTNFPTTASCFQERNAGVLDAFVCKLSYTGNSLLYSTYIGGSGDDLPYKIHVNNSRAVIGGMTNSSNIDNVKFGYDLTGNGSWDGFIAKVNNTGGSLDYFTFIGGSNAEFMWDFDIDPSNGDVYFIGDVDYNQNMKNFPKTKLGDSTFKGEFDCFIGKLSSSGSELKVISVFGGNKMDNTNSLVFEPISRKIYVTGCTQSIDFPVTEDYLYKLDNSYDPYICIFDPDSLSIQYSTMILYPHADMFSGTIRLQDNAYPIILTNTNKNYYPIIGKPIQSSIAGDIDAYFFKYVIGNIRLLSEFGNICTGDEIPLSWNISQNLERKDQLVQIKQISKEHWLDMGNRTGGVNLNVIIPEDIESGDDYKIRITHPSGLHSNEFGPFAIRSSPKILDFTTSTGETNVCENENFQIIAETNEDDLDYLWYHNGTEISGSNQSILEFDEIKPENSGEYWFNCSNYCKPDITSEKMKITVYETTEILEGPNDTTVTVGTTAMLWVNAIGGNMKYQWYKNDQVLLGAFDPILEIKNIKKSDEAFYHCEIEGACGTEISEKALIKVENGSSVKQDLITKGISIDLSDNIVSNELVFSVNTGSPTKCLIEIIDINGDIAERIYTGLINDYRSFKINVEPLSSASYWIMVRTDKGTITKKFIVYR